MTVITHTDTLPVMEAFSTLQGEGFHTVLQPILFDWGAVMWAAIGVMLKSPGCRQPPAAIGLSTGKASLSLPTPYGGDYRRRTANV